MIFLICFISIFLTLRNLLAITFQSPIHHIEEGQPALVYFQNGRVAEISKLPSEDYYQAQKAQNKKYSVKVELNKLNQIVSIKKVFQQQNKSFLKMQFAPGDYQKSILSSMDELIEIFKTGRKDFKNESQCFNRAHIWAYEWRKNHQIYSSKAWLFFTQQYIRKYKFEWWFHVAPVISFADQSRVKDRVMDIKYAHSPLSLKNWTDLFLRDNADCPVVSKFSDYADFPESGSCFVLKSTMYDYVPLDLEEEELSGIPKRKWIETEVKEAYFEAFNQLNERSL